MRTPRWVYRLAMSQIENHRTHTVVRRDNLCPSCDDARWFWFADTKGQGWECRWCGYEYREPA